MNYHSEKMLHYRLKPEPQEDHYPKANVLLCSICIISTLITLLSVLLTTTKR